MLFNRERATRLMEEFRIDALLATAQHNVLYLSDFIGWTQQTYGDQITQTFALVCRDENIPAGLIVSRQDETYLAARGTWIEDVRGYGGKGALELGPNAEPLDDEERKFLLVAENEALRESSAPASLVRLIRERGLENTRIGIDQEGMHPHTRSVLTEAFPNSEILEASSLFRLIRLAKTPDELERMRRATELNERAIQAFQKEVTEGLTEVEVASHYYKTIGEGGGRWYWFHLASGRRASAIFPPSEKKFEKGDSWKFDAGSRLAGYCADGGGCGVVGDPSPEIVRDWKAIEKGLEAGFSVMQAGVKGSKIFEAAIGAMQIAGIDYNGMFVGHTMGAEGREFPWTIGRPVSVDDPFLPESTDIPLPAGAVLSFEIPTGIFGVGGCHAEYTVVLTENGFEHLVDHPVRTLYRS